MAGNFSDFRRDWEAAHESYSKAEFSIDEAAADNRVAQSWHYTSTGMPPFGATQLARSRRQLRELLPRSR